jgi:hypothetical protein
MWFGFLKKSNEADSVKLHSGRRQWLAASARWAVVGVFAAATGMLWKRNGITLNRQVCTDMEGRLGCQECGAFDSCGHPRALSVKQFLEKHK